MGARFLGGLPHGVYFGVASLVAAGMAVPPGPQGQAVAAVMLGLSVANVVGVPAATWLGQHPGWRLTYWRRRRAGPGDGRAGDPGVRPVLPR